LTTFIVGSLTLILNSGATDFVSIVILSFLYGTINESSQHQKDGLATKNNEKCNKNSGFSFVTHGQWFKLRALSGDISRIAIVGDG